MLSGGTDDLLQVKAKLFRGFADPTRLAILETLRSGERSVTEITRETGICQSNVSNHLRCMLASGLVANRRDGKNIFYRYRDDSVARILSIGDALLSEAAGFSRNCAHSDDAAKESGEKTC